LRRNTFVEVAAGAVIIVIVAILGVSPPGHLELKTLCNLGSIIPIDGYAQAT
jgi:hypothetical protein